MAVYLPVAEAIAVTVEPSLKVILTEDPGLAEPEMVILPPVNHLIDGVPEPPGGGVMTFEESLLPPPQAESKNEKNRLIMKKPDL
jgi:hypothetical protein